MPELLDMVSLYTDGGSRGNPGPAAIGIIIYSPKGHVLASFRGFIGRTTNNQAEYAALSKGLAIASRFTRKQVRCYSDSELMISQLTRSYRVKSRALRVAVDLVREAEKAFEKVKYFHLRRSNPRIKRADRLVNLALDEAARGGEKL